MNTFTAIIAMSLSACLSAIAPILQKAGADREKRHKKFDLTLLARLAKNPAYMIGTAIQVISWVLSLVALRVLPLFLVQSTFAGSIIVTALTEKLIYRHKLHNRVYLSMATIILGLVLIGISAEPSRAYLYNLTSPLKLTVELAPIILIVLGLTAACLKHKWRDTMTALVGGLAFGGTALIGRLIVYPTPFWHLWYVPMFWSLIAYGLLGQYEMTMALQNASGTTTNTLVMLTGTLLPAILGLAYFNDMVRSGFIPLTALSIFLIVAGSLTIIKYDPYIPSNVKL